MGEKKKLRVEKSSITRTLNVNKKKSSDIRVKKVLWETDLISMKVSMEELLKNIHINNKKCSSWSVKL